MKARSFSISLSFFSSHNKNLSNFQDLNILKYDGRTDAFFPYIFSSIPVIGHENLYNFQDSSILKYERMIPLFGPPFFHTPCSLYSFHSLQHENLSTILKFDGRTHDSFISFPFFSSHNLRHKNLSNFSKIRVFWNMVNARSLYLALLFSIHFILYTRSTACNTKIFPIFKIRVFWNMVDECKISFFRTPRPLPLW